MAIKRSRRSRKRERQKKRHIPPRHLLEQGRQRLLEEDGRGALDLLRQAQHGDSSLGGLPLLLFCACMLRAHQLDSKGMAKEATAMRQAANEHRTSVVFQALTEADLVHYIRYLNDADALQIYADFLQKREPVPRVERMLADLLVIHQCWEGLEVFDSDHPLRRDAGWMQQAIGEMDAGNWERADSLLQGIVRRSPFASWRLFCKAMLCFNAGDDRSLQQAARSASRGFCARLYRCRIEARLRR